MSWKMKFVTRIFTIVFPLLAQASTQKEYLDFFQKYELLGDTFDNAVADMYSDEAKVSVLQVLEGTETTTKMNGKKVKKIIHEQMELIKKMDSKNDLSKISVEIEGNKATIKAKTNCQSPPCKWLKPIANPPTTACKRTCVREKWVPHPYSIANCFISALAN